MSAAHVSLPSTGAIRSRAFVVTSSLVIGFSGLPRTVSLRSVCVVPSLKYDLREQVAPWAYFCQISDSTTSYGSYSGATPNEKITWDKLTEETPMFVIESDATIVVPLMLSALLECKQHPAEAKALIAKMTG